MSEVTLTTAAGRKMTGDDFTLNTGWGHYGTSDAVIPAKAIVKRAYTPDERDVLGVVWSCSARQL